MHLCSHKVASSLNNTNKQACKKSWMQKSPNLLGTSKYQVVAEVMNLIEENESLVSLTIALLCAIQNKTIKEVVLWHSIVSHGMFMNECSSDHQTPQICPNLSKLMGKFPTS